MYLKVFVVFIKNIFACCYIHIQTAEPAFTKCLSCDLHCVCVWILRLPCHGLILKCTFLNRELSVANQLAPSVSANQVSVDSRV